jgi:hypothetical protein
VFSETCQTEKCKNTSVGMMSKYFPVPTPQREGVRLVFYKNFNFFVLKNQIFASISLTQTKKCHSIGHNCIGFLTSTKKNMLGFIGKFFTFFSSVGKPDPNNFGWMGIKAGAETRCGYGSHTDVHYDRFKK